MDEASLQYWLNRFVLEIRKKADGTEYPPETLHHICCGIMRYLRQNGRPEIDFFKNASFSGFVATLDSEMKRIQSKGIGSKRRQAEPLTADEEELLWQTGQLGDHSPQALLNSMVFMNGIYFALRSGMEHRALRFDPPQIQLIKKPGHKAYLQYTEDVSKNNPGGLKGRNGKPKVVIQHENTKNPTRCFVRLFQLYQNKCPPNRPKDAFYLQQLSTPTEHCWYSPRPVGHSTLAGTVAKMCKSAGIRGFKTNHSLRATTCTRLYQAGVEEQLIMERTGHHSIEGVRSYKRTSAQQQETLSEILSLNKKSRYDTSGSSAASTSSALVPPELHPTAGKSISSQWNQQVTIHPESSNLHRVFTFNNCSNINIHFN